jgi:hypothetical protein
MGKPIETMERWGLQQTETGFAEAPKTKRLLETNPNMLLDSALQPRVLYGTLPPTLSS